MILNELFKRTIDYVVTERTPYYFSAEFPSGNDMVCFSAEFQYPLAINDFGGEKEWLVVFATKDKTGRLNYYLTGKGNEFLVMSTIKAIMHEFFVSYSPETVAFTSSKSDRSRTKLYTRMCKNFIPSNYTMVKDTQTYDTTAVFKIVKKKS